MPEASPLDPPRAPFAAEDVDRTVYAAWREDRLRLGFLPAFQHGILLEVAMIAPGDEAAVGAIRQ